MLPPMLASDDASYHNRPTAGRDNLAQPLCTPPRRHGHKQFKVSGEMMAKTTATHLMQRLR